MQRGGLKAAARALAAPSEEGAGLTVDPDVAEEALSQRQRCAAYLSRAGVAPPAGFKPLPAQEAVLSGGDYGVEGIAAAHKAAGDGGDDVAVAELAGDELSQGERPFAIEMFGLRKVYKVSAGLGLLGWRPEQCKRCFCWWQALLVLLSRCRTACSPRTPPSCALINPACPPVALPPLQRGGLLRRRKPFVAVRGNWLGVHQGRSCAVSVGGLGWCVRQSQSLGVCQCGRRGGWLRRYCVVRRSVAL